MSKLKEEFFKILPPTIFFFVALHIVMFIRVLMLKRTGIAPSSSVSIAVAALILGKAVLIADMLPMINRYPNKPLIYNVAWKTVIYLVISAVIHYLERLIDFWRHAGSFVAGNQKLLAEMVWPHFFAIQIILFVLISMSLYDPRTGARNWEEKGAEDILRPDAYPASLNDAFMADDYSSSRALSRASRGGGMPRRAIGISPS